jgi:putative FmdB family regulatory protein
MPTYNYICSKCGEKFEEIKKISERREPENFPCPTCNEVESVVLLVMSPCVVSGVGSLLSKTSDGWRDRLKQLKKNNINSTINI